jgi:golgin subfamily B member 1
MIIGNNILYLSHDLPEMQEIESVYTFIWQWINQPARDQQHFDDILNIRNVRNVVLNEIWGLCQQDQLELMLGEETDEAVAENCFQKLVDAKWLDSEGKILIETSEITEDSLRKLVPPEVDNAKFQRIFFFLRDQKTRLKLVKIPNYFEKFVLLHLDTWIKSAVRALLIEDERQYIIDAIVSPSIRHADPSPIIIDLDTGADQPNSQWDESLHQFVQLKHGCKISLQSFVRYEWDTWKPTGAGKLQEDPPR